MSLDVEALRESFQVVVERSPDVVHRFYDTLFTRYPQARSLFTRNAREVQEKMLTQALGAVLDHLEDAPWLVSQLGAMGAKHVGYGVRDEMYAWVGESLLAALSEAAGEAWTPRVAQAWAGAYTAIQELMLAGARRERAGAKS